MEIYKLNIRALFRSLPIYEKAIFIITFIRIHAYIKGAQEEVQNQMEICKNSSRLRWSICNSKRSFDPGQFYVIAVQPNPKLELENYLLYREMRSLGNVGANLIQFEPDLLRSNRSILSQFSSEYQI